MVGGRTGSIVALALGLATAALLLTFVVNRGTAPIGAGDVFWQLRAGQTILETRAIPDTETYSFTAAGTPWNNHQWLYEAVLAAWYRVAGWAGVRFLVLVLVTITLLVVIAPWLRRGRLGFALLQSCLAVILIGYKFIPAPQTLAMLMLLSGYRLFLREDLLSNVRRYAGLCLFMLLFGNLTAESLMFVPFLVADQLGRARKEPRRWPKVVLRLALPCALLLLTPPQSSILEYAMMRGQSVNAEFSRLWEPAIVITPFARHLAWTIIACYLPFVVVRVTRARGVGSDAAVGLTAVVGALLLQRNLFLLLIPIEHMLLAWAEREEAAGPQSRRARSGQIAVLVACVLFASLAFSVRWSPASARVLFKPAYWQRHINPISNPVACLAAVQSLPEGSRVFTKHLWASYLIWQAPNVRIFVDGRNREYPEVVHRAAFQIERGGGEALLLLDRSGSEWVLADPGWISRIPSSRWRLHGQGHNCALFAGNTATAP